MVRSEIISKLSHKIHRQLKKSELELIINTILETIVLSVKEEKNVELRNFGTFSPKKIKAKTNARNPKTGEIINTLEKRSILFRMSKKLKMEINKKERKIN